MVITNMSTKSYRCDDCGRDIPPKGTLVVASGLHFCSVDCYTNPSRVCGHCGCVILFQQKGFLSPVTKRWFCNNRCHYMWTLKARHK